MSTPRVTVMMPICNAETFLARAIQSILDQTEQNWELIAIDDGSKDRSADILVEFARKDSRIVARTRENRGAIPTRNEILDLARGQYVACLDADDIAKPDRLANQASFLDFNPDVVLVGGAFDLIDEAGRFLTTLRPPTDDAEIQKLLLAGNGAIAHPAAMYRRDAVEKVGRYSERYPCANDVELWLRLGEVGKVANLKQTVTQFRLHEKSVSATRGAEQRALAKRACEEAAQRRGIPCTFDASAPWRPGNDRESRHKFAMQYGWWAFKNAQKSTAQHYAWKAIKAQPWKSDGWRLLVVATLKAPPLMPST